MPKRVAVRRPPEVRRALPSLAAVAREPFAVVTDDEVRVEAYRRWEAAGRPHGDGVQFWLEAEWALRRAGG